MPTVRGRHCDLCDVSFDVLVFKYRGISMHMDTDEVSDVPTCSCGNTDLRKLITSANVIWTGDESSYSKIYPYYDRSLKMRIHNKQHHDRVMKARGLEHGTANDIEKLGSRLRAQDAECIAKSEKYDRDLEEHPKYRGYREQRAKGVFTEHVPKDKREKFQKALMRNEKR
jgi:hypothetical protein